MIPIPEYNSLEEKSIVFEQTVIETESELNEWISLSSEFPVIYRGVPESKFKLYNSLQRYWISHKLEVDIDLYSQYISSVITELKANNDELFTQFFDLFKPKFTEYAVLSTLQHFGGMSPLLDFTQRKEVSLYFASDLNEYNPCRSRIDNYSSVYEVRQSKVYHTVNFFNSVISKFENDHSQIIERTKSAFTELNLTQTEIEEAMEQSQVAALSFIPFMKNWKCGLIADFKETSSYGFGTKSNLNILIQQGVFLFNYHPTQTVDESMREFFEETIKSAHVTNDDASYNQTRHIKCYDIHKSLVPLIHKYLNSMGINRVKLFPNISSMVKSSELRVISELLRRTT